MLVKTVANINAYFAPHASQIAASARLGASAALKAAARRRRAYVLKPANSLPSSFSSQRASKVQFSGSAYRRARLASSPVKMHVKPAPEAPPATRRTFTAIPLPTRLERPVFQEISEEKLAAVAPEMKDTPAQYIRDLLEGIGAKMLSVLASTTTPPLAASSSMTLPKEVPVTIRSAEAVLPTHMLAVHSSIQPAKGARKVTLFPAHSLMLAANCASLPAFPTSSISSGVTSDEDAGTTKLTLPILPLAVPSPETFAPLSSYLYTHRADTLLSSLLPYSPDMLPSDSEMDASESLRVFAENLAARHPKSTLLNHTLRVHGLWRNVCALGVHDERLWRAIDVSWAICLGALGKSMGIEAPL